MLGRDYFSLQSQIPAMQSPMSGVVIAFRPGLHRPKVASVSATGHNVALSQWGENTPKH